MKPRTLLVLFLIVGGLGAFVWFYERELPSSEERVAQAKKVLPLEVEEIERVVIERDGETIELLRAAPAGEGAADGAVTTAATDEAAADDDEQADDDAEAADGDAEGDGDEPDPFAPRRWRIAAPLQAAADPTLVRELLDGIAQLEKERTLEDMGRKEAGLEPPAVKVTFEADDGPQVLEVGAEIPASTTMLAAVAGEPGVHVVPSSILAALRRAPGDWRSKELFPGGRDEVERLTLRGGADPAGGGAVLLVRRGDEFWIEGGAGTGVPADRADRDLVDGLLTQLTGLQAQAFHDTPPPAADLGLEPPQGVLEAVLDGQSEPFRVVLGAPAGDDGSRRYARVGELVVEIDAAIAQSLDRPASEWQSKAWTGLEVFEIDSATVATAATATAPVAKVTIARSGTDWKRGEDIIPFTPVSDLLYAVTGARADQLVAGPPPPSPEITVELVGSEGEKETLTLYPPRPDGLVPARSSAREVTLLLPASVRTEVLAKLDELKQAKPVEDVSETATTD